MHALLGDPFYAKGWPSMKMQSFRVGTIQYLIDPINLFAIQLEGNLKILVNRMTGDF